MAAKTFYDILKGNPYHDERGRFTTGPKARNPMIRTDPPPQKTKIAYKVFVARDGKLYPPMVANPDGMDTPVGVWLDAAEGTKATDKDGNPITNTLGRNKVKAGGKGTQGGSGTLAYRPGWHLGELPEAKQFYTKDKETGEKKQKKNFVWAECEIAADFDYQQEAMSYGYNKNGKFQHSLAGLPKIPKDGYYTYRTNPDPTTQPWYITGSMKVNRILTDKETNEILRSHGIEPMKRDGGELDLKALGFTETNFVKKSSLAEKSVLFIGLKIANAEPLAIEGGENHEDFHVTLAYGYFNGAPHDESAVDSIVQAAIKENRDLIPDKIHFDAIKRFTASNSSDGKDVIYAQVAAGQLEKAHNGLLKSLKKHGIKLEDTFPTYKPHMTLAYIDPEDEYDLSEIDATGDAVRVMIGYGKESSSEHNFTILKADDDKRLVFGWASISITVDGEQLEDRQKDMIDPEDLEEAAYEYVLNFRDTGEEHVSTMRKKGKLVESCVFTAEKQKAIGIPEGTLPIGWWIGFKIEDDAAWEKVKNGTYRMFSIEGKANRVPVEKSRKDYDEYPEYGMWLEENLDATREEQKAAEEHYRKQKTVAKTFAEILKFNPYHDNLGRFASAGSHTQFTLRTRDPQKQYMADMAIAREKERAAAAAAATNPTNDPDTIAGVKRGAAMTHEQADEGRGNPHYSDPAKAEQKMQEAHKKYWDAIRRGAPDEEVARYEAEENKYAQEYNKLYAENRQYRINCQSCVVAYEARLRGYDVEATGRNKKNPTQEKLATNCESAWIDPATGKTPSVLKNDPKIKTSKQAQKWLEENVEAGGRYEFSHGWKGTNGYNGHIVTVSRNDSGAIRIFDPQNGKTYEGSEYTAYMDRIKSTYSIKQYNPRKSSGWESIPNGRLQLLRVDNLQINPDVANSVLKGAE